MNIFLFVEKIFQYTKIHVPEIVAKSMRDGSLCEKFLQLTNESIVSSEAKLNTINNCIALYVKIRAYAHAKHVIEKDRHDSKKERKEKALRKKLKTSHDGVKI